MTKWFTSLLCLGVVSCVSTRPNIPPKISHREPTATAKIFKPKGEWKINSLDDLNLLCNKTGATVIRKDNTYVVDLKGAVLDGSLQKGNEDQSEDQTPLFRAYIPLYVKNGFVKHNKNAAIFYKPNSGVEGLTWLTVGEDAVATYDGATNFIIKNCEFINNKNGDKTIQLNEAKGAKIENNIIYAGTTGARVGEINMSESSNKAYCSNNTFVGVDTAFNVGKVKLEVIEKNKYKSVRLPFKVTAGAKIINPDGKIEEK